MDNENKPCASTGHESLIHDLINPNIPKSEREHAAAREIEKLLENKQPILTDEEVWLRAYCAAISNGKDDRNMCLNISNVCLNDFRKIFRNNNE